MSSTSAIPVRRIASKNRTRLSANSTPAGADRRTICHVSRRRAASDTTTMSPTLIHSR